MPRAPSLGRCRVADVESVAAQYYASSSLLPALQDLRDDEEDPTLQASILACDPVQAASWEAMYWTCFIGGQRG